MTSIACAGHGPWCIAKLAGLRARDGMPSGTRDGMPSGNCEKSRRPSLSLRRSLPNSRKGGLALSDRQVVASKGIQRAVRRAHFRAWTVRLLALHSRRKNRATRRSRDMEISPRLQLFITGMMRHKRRLRSAGATPNAVRN